MSGHTIWFCEKTRRIFSVQYLRYQRILVHVSALVGKQRSGDGK